MVKFEGACGKKCEPRKRSSRSLVNGWPPKCTSADDNNKTDIRRAIASLATGRKHPVDFVRVPSQFSVGFTESPILRTLMWSNNATHHGCHVC